jgi:thioredoxin 2
MSWQQTTGTKGTIEADDRGLVLACPSCGKFNRLVYERLAGHKFRCTQCGTEIPQPTEPVTVVSEASFEALTGRSPLPVLVDFWAAWCGPCKMVAPEVATVAAEGAGRWLVAKVDTEALQNLASRLGIQAIPMLMVFKGGREVSRQPGAVRAPAIRRLLEQAL